MNLIEQLKNRNKDISKKNGLKSGLTIQVTMNGKLIQEVSHTLSPYSVEVSGRSTLVSVLDNDRNAFGYLETNINLWKTLHVKMIDANNKETYIPFTDLTIDQINTNTLQLYDNNAKNLSA